MVITKILSVLVYSIRTFGQSRKCCFIDTYDAIRDRNACQAAATFERRRADAGDTIGNRDAREATAIVERGTADVSDTIRDRDARQAAATFERILADAGQLAVCAKCYRGQAIAMVERTFTNIRNAIGNSDFFEVDGICKAPASNVAVKALRPADTGHRLALVGRGDGNLLQINGFACRHGPSAVGQRVKIKTLGVFAIGGTVLAILTLYLARVLGRAVGKGDDQVAILVDLGARYRHRLAAG